MGTSQSSPSTTLETLCSTSDVDNSIDHERKFPHIVFNENDLFGLECNRHLYHQSTESLCASSAEDEIEDDDHLDEEWNERLLILEDAANLARLAEFYLNPHKQLVPSDPYAYGRNYFTRPSAYKLKTMDGDEEEDDDIQCIIHAREGERVWDPVITDTESRVDGMTTHLGLESKGQHTNRIVSLDPSCVVRFGMQYDVHR